MSLETLLQAAEFVESSSGPNTKENPSNARATGNISSNVFVDRRRVVSESDATERRRRPGGAGTRETHNKLEKNRRAHLKECFDILKNQVPTLEEKKTSNLNILRSALKYIQTMKSQEQDYVSEVDFLKTNNKNLLERLGSLKNKTKVEQKVPCSSSTAKENDKASSDSKKPNCLPSDDLDSRIPPISVATQTTPNLDKDGATPSSARELEEASNTCVSTSSSTDTGIEGDESDRKISICEDDDDDEKTDTDEELNDDDNDSEIDVVGPDDSSSDDSLQIAVENKINGEIEVEKKKASSETRGRNASKSPRKRSKSEMKYEEDSDYDENTKEEPKAKIQACARVSV